MGRFAPFVVIFCFILAVLPPVVVSDRGIVTPFKKVYVSEPQQKALIVWNGEVEMLYLTTDVRAIREGEGKPGRIKAVEIIPFPSRPDVKLADEETFIKLNDLLREKKARMRLYGYHNEKAGSGEIVSREEEIPGVYVEFQEMVGIHNITVVRVENLDGFMYWLEIYFREINGENYTLPDDLPVRIQHYLNYNINYFSLDVISSLSYYFTMSVPPVVYTFNTTYLYYPMYISGGMHDWGEIRLFIITDQELPRERIEWYGFHVDDVLPLKNDELRRINETASSLPLRKYLQMYVVTSYVDYSRLHPDLYLLSGGPYQPPLVGAWEAGVIGTIFILSFVAMYVIWKKALAK